MTIESEREVSKMCTYAEAMEKRGKKLERELLNKLTKLLLAEKRYDDLDKAADDEKYQDELLKEYNLI